MGKLALVFVYLIKYYAPDVCNQLINALIINLLVPVVNVIGPIGYMPRWGFCDVFQYQLYAHIYIKPVITLKL